MKKVNNELICIEDESASSLTTPKELPYIFVTEFNDGAVTKFYEQFLELNAKPSVKVIPVVVSSFGGQVHSLLSMIDIIKSTNKPVATIGLGKAMSCGMFLLASGTKGYRYAAPNTDIMIHEVSAMDYGKVTDLQNNGKQTKKLNDNLFYQLSEIAGKDKKFFIEELKKRGNVDWYVTADEFKRLGLIDHVSVPQLAKK